MTGWTSAEAERPVRLPSHVPAQPLVEVVQGRGGIMACVARIGCVRRREALERTYRRAVIEDRLTWTMADRLAIGLLGLHPMLVWGEEWLMADQ